MPLRCAASLQIIYAQDGISIRKAKAAWKDVEIVEMPVKPRDDDVGNEVLLLTVTIPDNYPGCLPEQPPTVEVVVPANSDSNALQAAALQEHLAGRVKELAQYQEVMVNNLIMQAMDFVNVAFAQRNPPEKVVQHGGDMRLTEAGSAPSLPRARNSYDEAQDSVDKERQRVQQLESALPRSSKSKFGATKHAAPEKLQLLATGKHARCWLAVHNKAPIALKEYTYQAIAANNAPHSGAEAALKSELQELELEVNKLAALPQHDNVCGFRAIAFSQPPIDGTTTISVCTEYCSGGSIATLLHRHGPFSTDAVNKYSRGMINGLRFLHGAKIIHQNIKASTVFLDNEGSPRLAYFGSSNRRIKALCANECADGNTIGNTTARNPASDGRDLACVIKEMLLGQQPEDTVVTLSMRKELSDIVNNWLNTYLPNCLEAEGEAGISLGLPNSSTPWASKCVCACARVRVCLCSPAAAVWLCGCVAVWLWSLYAQFNLGWQQADCASH